MAKRFGDHGVNVVVPEVLKVNAEEKPESAPAFPSLTGGEVGRVPGTPAILVIGLQGCVLGGGGGGSLVPEGVR